MYVAFRLTWPPTIQRRTLEAVEHTKAKTKHSLFEYNLLLITAAYAGMALFLLLVDMNSASNMGKIGEGTSH